MTDTVCARPNAERGDLREMKAVVAKLFPTLASMLLVAVFLAVAIMVGHYALAGAAAASASSSLLGALALCGVAYSAVAGRPAGTTLSSLAVARRKRPCV
jgi:hypothetical protein